MRAVPKALPAALLGWLGNDGVAFFKRVAATYNDLATAAWVDGRLPHPVHFREGMAVRNFMRQSGLCEDWTAEEFDNTWADVVLLALEEAKVENAIEARQQQYLDNAFSYHAPKEDQPKRYEILRSDAKRVATVILALCPDSRERSLALTKLEEALMWANASIARNE